MQIGYYAANQVLLQRLQEKGYGQKDYAYKLAVAGMAIDMVPYDSMLQAWEYWVRKNPKIKLTEFVYGLATSITGYQESEIERWYKEWKLYK